MHFCLSLQGDNIETKDHLPKKVTPYIFFQFPHIFGEFSQLNAVYEFYHDSLMGKKCVQITTMSKNQKSILPSDISFEVLTIKVKVS